MRNALLFLASSLWLVGCFTHGSDHFAYPTDGIPMPDLRGRWMSYDMNGTVDSGFQVVIGDLPPSAPAWERLGDGDSVLRTRGGLYYRDGLSFTYWSRVSRPVTDSVTDGSYRAAPSMVVSFFRLGNDTFFETHLPEQYLDRPVSQRCWRTAWAAV